MPQVNQQATGLQKATALALAAVANGEDTTGFCLACGAEASCVKPEAEEYECEICGEAKVYGAEQIVLLYGGYS